MAYSRVEYTGDGTQTNFTFSFPYISQTHVKASLDTVETEFTWINSSTIQISPAPAAGAVVAIYRETSRDSRLVDFENGAIVNENSLDTSALQSFYLAQESIDAFEGSIAGASAVTWDAKDRRIVNLADPEDGQDAVTKQWAETGMTSQLNLAEAFATAAAASETAAETSKVGAELAQAEAEAARDAANAIAVEEAFIATGTTEPRTLADRFSDIVNVRDFGAVGDGVTDDTAAIQAAVDYIASIGGTLYVPPGVFNLGAVISRSSQTKPFKITGAGRDATSFVRSAAYGSPFVFTNCDGLELSDFAVDAGYSTYPASANHGVEVGLSNYAAVKRVKVTNYLNTGIIVLNILNDYSISGCLVEECETDGGGVANNGILMGGLVDSHIIKCQASDLDKVSGSPGYGLQLKNKCRGCSIQSSHAYSCKAGYAFGQDITATAVTDSFLRDNYAFDCTFPIILGYAEDNEVNGLVADMNAANENPIYFNAGNKRNVIKGVIAKNIRATSTFSTHRSTVLFEGSNEDNYVEIDTSEHLGTGYLLAYFFDTSVVRNHVHVKRVTTHSPMFASSAARWDDSADSGNALTVDGVTTQDLVTIADDAVTLKNRHIHRIKVDTEAEAVTDDLATISNGYEGQTLIVQSLSNTRDVVIKHGTGNILTKSGADVTLAAAQDAITLVYDTGLSGGAASWCEV